MNAIFIGDIVGPAATAYVAARVPELRRSHDAALVIANGENCAVTATLLESAFGMTEEAVETLIAGGVDVITGGNHSWDGPAAESVLAHPRVLRPLNLPLGTPGKGAVTLEVGHERVTVVNLTDPGTIPAAEPVWAAWLALEAAGELARTVIVDFHAKHAATKQAMALAVDGRVAAVLGTDTHEPTLHLRLLPGGTAQVSDVGMTGPTGGAGGISARYRLAKLKGVPAAELPPPEPATGPIELGAVLLRIEHGRTQAITRLT